MSKLLYALSFNDCHASLSILNFHSVMIDGLINWNIIVSFACGLREMMRRNGALLQYSGRGYRAFNALPGLIKFKLWTFLENFKLITTTHSLDYL